MPKLTWSDMSGRRATAAQQVAPMEYMPGEVIVRFKGDVMRPLALRVQAGDMDLRAATRSMPEAVTAPMNYLRDNMGLRAVNALFHVPKGGGPFEAPRTMARQSELLQSFVAAPGAALGGLTVMRVNAKEASPSRLRHLGAAAGIDFVEPMPARWLASKRGRDPFRSVQWALHAIGWSGAKRPDARKLAVCVIDTGIDTGHPEFAGRIASYDAFDFSPDDVLGHGTHVAGIIAAKTNNRIGISGVANTRLRIWKVFPDKPHPLDGRFYVDGESYLKALGAVLESGARVVNLSLGGTASSQTEALLFQQMHAAGIVVVAAMGNAFRFGNPTQYPAAYKGVMAVGATNVARRRADFSSTGRHVWLVAPGEDILSTLPMQASPYRESIEYGSESGTSMAAPHVAAAVALLLAKRPELTAAEVFDRFKQSAAKLPDMNGKSFTHAFGHGQLDLVGLLG